MEFQVSINGAPAGSLQAANACDAVDSAREAHKIPPEGGKFDFEISCTESWIDSAGKTQAPGVVSSFSVEHEPEPHLREAVEAERAAAAEKAKHDELVARIREEERAKLQAELAGKAVSQ